MKKATTTMKKKKSNREDVDVMNYEARAPLQAVLLADLFSSSFRPVSLDRPKVLCPMNNVTMLDYSIESLAEAGVKEIICVCTSDDVEQYVSEITEEMEVKVKFIKDRSLTNAGDALREVDRSNLVQSNPFVLMHGDAVTNVDLPSIIKEHKQRNKKDRRAIMTLLLQQDGPHSKLRPPSSDLVVSLSPHDNRIRQYDDVPSNSTTEWYRSILASVGVKLPVRSELVDCGLYVCSPQLLAAFTEYFDSRDILGEFVPCILAQEEEILQHKLHAHVLDKPHYAARITDFAAYHTVSRDLLQRWRSPFIPDRPPSGYITEYHDMGQNYFWCKEQYHPTKIGPSSSITGPGMVGSNGHIGKDCCIEATVIGHNCSFGDGVTLRDCHVWDGVTIEDGATLEKSILADGVVIKKGAKVSRGCIVGSGCIIGANVVLPEYTRITQATDTDGQQENHFDSLSSLEEDSGKDSTNKGEPEDVTSPNDHEVVGPDGVGRVWWMPLIQDDDEESDDEDGVDSTVVQEIKSICLERHYDAENLCIELRRHKITKVRNVTFADCTMGATLAMLEKLNVTEKMSSKESKGSRSEAMKELENSVSKALGYWAIVLNDLKQEGLEEELGIIAALEMLATSASPTGAILSKELAFRIFIQTFYYCKEDVLSKEAILEWAAQRQQEDPTSPLGKLFQQKYTQDFVESVEQSSEEDDDDDSSEEEEESD